MNRFHEVKSQTDSGVALILVLGVLSLMLLLAVSFAISMRTERLAAGNYADAVRARQLAQVGLVRAMDDICRIMGTGLGHPGGLVYPLWPVTNSYSIVWTNSCTNTLLRLNTNASDSATHFIPRALWTAVANADNWEPSNHWVEIWANNDLIGRVGYLILNCSGLLDANFAGGVEIPRQYGTTPGEIAVNQLGELPADFFVNRNTDVRYETLDELAVLNSFQPTNFCVYSRCPAGYWDAASGAVRTQVNLAGTAGDIYNRRVPITDALTNIDFLSSDAYILWKNLVDYVDADPDPTNLTTCVEAVPMINEIIVSNVVSDAGGGNLEMNTTVCFELWYPFVRASANTFDLQYKAAFTDIAGAGFVPANITTWKSLPPTVTPGAQSFTVRSDSLPFVTLPSGTVKFKSAIDARVVFVAGGNEADNVESIEVTNEHVGVPSFWAGSECLDPRFNGYLTQWRQEPSPTLSNTNTWTANYLLTNDGGDTDTKMHVANGSLRSVAELGCLVYSSNAPWHTVKLYGTNLHRVLDVFALDTNSPSSDYVVTTNRGLVNPNSIERDTLAAVFADMPVDEYPGGPSNRLSMASARTIADRLYTGGFYTNLSDIGRGLTDFSGLGVPISSELQKESLFRNACGLLSVRQNLFTILIEAQVASGRSFPRNMARQRAVAIVWRDPYTGEFFVRSFQGLDD